MNTFWHHIINITLSQTDILLSLAGNPRDALKKLRNNFISSDHIKKDVVLEFHNNQKIKRNVEAYGQLASRLGCSETP